MGMKYKVRELEGELLDAAVAEVEGMAGPWINDEDTDTVRSFRPSSDWAQGGPIIERERILFYEPADYGETIVALAGDHRGRHKNYLIAAMRAYVASRFGDEVDLP